MPQTRDYSDKDSCTRDNAGDSAIRSVETLRNAAAAGGSSRPGKKEDRFSVFWRVFGTTILSIAALVVITVYQEFTSTVNELRSNVNHLTESRGDLVKTDEFNSRTASLWSSIKDLQADKTAFSALKERSALLEQQMKDGQEQVNGRFTALGSTLKEEEGTRTALEALKERLALLEQQVKSGEEERKDLVRELQQLREREATVEGRQGVVPSPSAAVHGEK